MAAGLGDSAADDAVTVTVAALDGLDGAGEIVAGGTPLLLLLTVGVGKGVYVPAAVCGTLASPLHCVLAHVDATTAAPSVTLSSRTTTELAAYNRMRCPLEGSVYPVRPCPFGTDMVALAVVFGATVALTAHRGNPLALLQPPPPPSAAAYLLTENAPL